MEKTFEDWVKAFAKKVEEDSIERLKRMGISYEGFEKSVATRIRPGRKYVKVDVGDSGRYMIEIETGEVYGIKAYGVIHRGHYYGKVQEFEGWNWGGYYGREAG